MLMCMPCPNNRSIFLMNNIKPFYLSHIQIVCMGNLSSVINRNPSLNKFYHCHFVFKFII